MPLDLELTLKITPRISERKLVFPFCCQSKKKQNEIRAKQKEEASKQVFASWLRAAGVRPGCYRGPIAIDM